MEDKQEKMGERKEGEAHATELKAKQINHIKKQ